jgi:hypothetical protein
MYLQQKKNTFCSLMFLGSNLHLGAELDPNAFRLVTFALFVEAECSNKLIAYHETVEL